MPLNQISLLRITVFSHSTQLIWRLLDIKNCPLFLAPNSVILNHPAINSCIFTLKFQHWLWCNSFENEVIVAMWAILVGFFEFCSILSEGFFALFAGEYLSYFVRQNNTEFWS